MVENFKRAYDKLASGLTFRGFLFARLAELADAPHLGCGILRVQVLYRVLGAIGETGRHAGLKTLSSGTGSSPVWRTNGVDGRVLGNDCKS